MATAGYSCVLYAKASAPADAAVSYSKDVEMNANGNAIDVSSRAGAGWKEFIMGLSEWDVSIDQLWVPTDTVLQAIRAAFLAKTLFYIKIVDAAGYGFSGSGYFTSMKQGQPLDGGVMLPFTFKGTGALTAVTP